MKQENLKKTQRLLKMLSMVGVFGLSYIGFTATNQKMKIGGEEVSITISALSNQAKAQCEATEPWPSPGLGNCNGFGRCAVTSSSGDCRP